MQNKWVLSVVLSCCSSLFAAPESASMVVAPADATEKMKATADLVCDGVDDQEELQASLQKAKRYKTRWAGAPNAEPWGVSAGRYTVTWLPGSYKINALLDFPEITDFTLSAEGSYLQFQRTEGDVIHINHSIRCRYNFGTIDSGSSGTTITVTAMTMSIVRFTGLIGHKQTGTGLKIYGAGTNKFEGTDIAGFDVGILVDDTAPKLDTNWFWISYIRNCNTCIWEKGNHVDNNVWYVNVDATLAGSVGIRTAADMGYWHIIMGTYGFERKNRAVILDPGAEDNFIFVQPPIETFAWKNNSGNDSNVIMSSRRYRKLLRLIEK